MYGLEKKKTPEKFDFGLEDDIKKNPAKGKELLVKINKNIHDIRQLLREGKNSQQELDDLGVLLHGYSAMEKVLTKVVKAK